MKGLCKFCQIEFDMSGKPSNWMANHTRWCKNNPKYSKYKEDAHNRILVNPKMVKPKNLGVNQFTKAKKDGKIINSKLKNRKSTRNGYKHSDEVKSRLSKSALNSKHRRLRKNPIEYNGIMLDSIWELELAKRLDSLNIKWTRPDPLIWFDDNGIKHNYFPDFYLIDYDLYLDPKNKHAYTVQINKINKLNKLYTNIRWILSLDDCINFKI